MIAGLVELERREEARDAAARLALVYFSIARRRRASYRDTKSFRAVPRGSGRGRSAALKAMCGRAGRLHSRAWVLNRRCARPRGGRAGGPRRNGWSGRARPSGRGRCRCGRTRSAGWAVQALVVQPVRRGAAGPGEVDVVDAGLAGPLLDRWARSAISGLEEPLDQGDRPRSLISGHAVERQAARDWARSARGRAGSGNPAVLRPPISIWARSWLARPADTISNASVFAQHLGQAAMPVGDHWSETGWHRRSAGSPRYRSPAPRSGSARHDGPRTAAPTVRCRAGRRSPGHS